MLIAVGRIFTPPVGLCEIFAYLVDSFDKIHFVPYQIRIWRMLFFSDETDIVRAGTTYTFIILNSVLIRQAIHFAVNL